MFLIVGTTKNVKFSLISKITSAMDIDITFSINITSTTGITTSVASTSGISDGKLIIYKFVHCTC